MPRWLHSFGRPMAAFVVAGLLGLTTSTAHADPEPPSDRPTASPQDTNADPDVSRFARPRPPRSRFVWSLGLGYVFQGLYGVPMGGVDMDALLGAESETVTFGADIEGMSGSTRDGLSTTALNAGPFIEGHFDRLRIGGGIRMGAFNVDRVTNGGSLFSLSEGVFLRLSVDVFRFNGDTGAVFLFAKGSADSVGGALFGVAVGAGVRL
jgi:hypothetical protein